MDENTIKLNSDEITYIIGSLQGDIESHILHLLESDYQGFFAKLNSYIGILFNFHSHGLMNKENISKLEVVKFFNKSLDACLNKDLEQILATLDQLLLIIPELEIKIQNINRKINELNF